MRTTAPSILEVRDPESGQVIAEVRQASASDARDALERASRACAVARALPAHRRASILRDAADRIHASRESFATTIAREGIKTIREARLEVDRCVMTLKLSAEESQRLTGETIAFDQRPGSEERFGYTVREPVGIVLAITPFNDPLNLVAHKVGPAIAAGNAILLKPHHQTPLSALRLGEALKEAGLPENILQILVGSGEELGTALLPDPRVRLITFTGGRVNGTRIAALAGLKRMSMELGSNCPTLIAPDADLASAASACVSGAYWAAGQNCLHVQRILAHQDIYADFRRRFLELTARYRLGPKLGEDTDMGCLIDSANAERIASTLNHAKAAGARVLSGGEHDGTRFAPTVVEGVPEDHPLWGDEIFGPVTLLASFTSLSDAIRRANQVDYGLQAAIFTHDLETALIAQQHLDVGAVIVNDSTDYRLDAMPFGGRKGSGFGKEGVRAAMLEMSEIKVICFNRYSS